MFNTCDGVYLGVEKETPVTLNETLFKDFNFVGKYIGSDGIEKIISDKGMLGAIKYAPAGNQVISYDYIYIDSLKGN